jgi:hypothetical protein
VQSPSEVRRRVTEEEVENHEREHNWGPSCPRWNHHYRPLVSPIPGSSVLRLQMQGTHSNGSDRYLQHTPSQSSLHSEGSLRPSSPADLAHQHNPGYEKTIHECKHNWGLQQQKWTHTHTRKQAASPNPSTSHSRIQTTQSQIPAPMLGQC